MARRNSDGSHVYTRIGRIRGREAEGDKAIIVEHRERTRVAEMGPAPERTALSGTEELVNSGDVVDVRRVHDIKTGQRRTVVLPADLCRRLNIAEGTPLRLIERDGSFEVIPMRLVAAHEDPTRALGALLDRVTPENTHGEVDTGPAVGRETL
jgi:antitoxin component of MazEF toxin-antitoxin module